MLNTVGVIGLGGHGRSSGVEALEEYTQVKSVWVETAAHPSQPFGYAPTIDYSLDTTRR